MPSRRWLLAVPMGTLLLFSLAHAQDANRGGPGQPPPPPGQGQGPPNFDPARMREMFLNGIKDQLGASEDEWKVLKPKVEKVQTAQFATFAGFGGMGGRGPGRPGGPGGPGGGPGGPGGNQQESKVAKAQRELGEALANKDTPTPEITQKLATLRETRDKARAELQAARKDLREVVTPRQEAVLVIWNLLE
jgi:hypothetical protein